MFQETWEKWGCWIFLVILLPVMYVLFKFNILPIALPLLFGSLFAWVKLNEILEKRRRERDGYGVEPVSPATRRGEDWWGVDYFHGATRIWFDGKVVDNKQFVLFFPTKEYWPSAVPEYLTDQREIILQRIMEKLDRSGYRNKYNVEEINGNPSSER